MTLRTLLGPLFLGLLTWLASTPLMAQVVGTLERAQGNVQVVGIDHTPRAVTQSEPVREGETIQTGVDGEVLLKMIDNAVIALRPNTTFKLVEYRMKGVLASDASFMQLLRGSLRVVSGLIAKANPERFRITTPTATIGVRGTDLEVTFLPDGSTDGQPGTYNYVHDGATFMQMRDGQTIDVQANQAAYAPLELLTGVTRMLLLNERPAFMRGGIFDNELVDLAARLIRAQVQQRLEQSIQQHAPQNVPGLGGAATDLLRRFGR